MNDSHEHAHVLLPPPLLVALGLIVGAVLQWRMPWHMLPTRLLAVGVALVAASIALSLWAVWTMRSAGTALDPAQPVTALVVVGPFAYTRNPIYVAMIGASLGIAFSLNTWWLIATTLGVFCVLHYGVIIREERYLSQRFGAAYVTYQQRVRRWL
jgi:protein-S-isoprenylcysteine O-methyltransferase Ste14